MLLGDGGGLLNLVMLLQRLGIPSYPRFMDI